MEFKKESRYHQLLVKTYGESKAKRIIKLIGNNSLGFELVRKSTNIKGGMKGLKKQ